MGGRNSKQAQINFMRDYDIIQQNTTQNITFLQHKINEDEYLLKQFNFNDKKECDKILDKLVILKSKLAGNKHVVPLKDYITSSQDQYCSTFYKIFALFQYPQRTLDDQICQRRLHKKRFSETQLWSILASCIVGLSHLQKNNIKHSALKSNNILLSRQGIIKVSDPFALGQHSNYQNALTKRQTKHAYLSPQQTQSLQQQIITPSLNSYKTDVWTLGMIMLQASFLQYQDDQCYRDDKQRIHWQTVKYSINRLGQVYSIQFKNMIEFMLAPQQKSRPDWIQLQNHVMKNNEQGRHSYPQDQFKPTSPPAHLQNFGLNGNKQYPLDSNTKNNETNTNTNNNPPVLGGMPRQQMVYKQYPQKLPIIMQQPPQHVIPTNNFTFGTYHNVPRPLSPRFSGSVPAQTYKYPNPVLMTNPVAPTPPPPSINPSQLGYQPNSQTFINSLGNSAKVINNINYSSVGQSNISTNPKSLAVSGSDPQNSHYNITPLNISNIQKTRPTRNIFPMSSYIQKTKIDENIIIVAEEQLQIQSVSPRQKQNRQQYAMNPNNHFPTGNINQNYGMKKQQPKYQYNYNQQQQTVQRNIIQPNRFSSYSSPGPLNGQIINNLQNKAMRPFTINNQFSQQNRQIQINQQSNNFGTLQPAHQINTHPTYSAIQFNNQPLINQNPFPTNITVNQVFNPQVDTRQEYVTEQFKLGSKYIGYKLNGMRHGYGKFYYQDGGMYDGNWKQNRMQGLGKLFYQSGKLAYQGNWKNDQFTGKGTLYNQTPQLLQHPFDCSNFDEVDEFWTKYQGQFLQDLKNGKGILYFSNGQRFDGYFKGDCVDGPGVFYCKNGTKINGTWVQNRRTK